jgi:hypothetical protein
MGDREADEGGRERRTRRRGGDEREGAASNRSRSRSPERPAASADRPILLSVTLFREGDKKQLLNGTVFIKTARNQRVAQVAGTFCRWAVLPSEAVALFSGSRRLDPNVTIESTGVAMGSPVIAYITKDGPSPDATAVAAPYHVVDVLDSELSAALNVSGL